MRVKIECKLVFQTVVLRHAHPKCAAILKGMPTPTNGTDYSRLFSRWYESAMSCKFHIHIAVNCTYTVVISMSTNIGKACSIELPAFVHVQTHRIHQFDADLHREWFWLTIRTQWTNTTGDVCDARAFVGTRLFHSPRASPSSFTLHSHCHQSHTLCPICLMCRVFEVKSPPT